MWGPLGIWKFGRGSLKTKKSFPRIGGTEKGALHVVILLGSRSADKIGLSESGDSCILSILGISQLLSIGLSLIFCFWDSN